MNTCITLRIDYYFARLLPPTVSGGSVAPESDAAEVAATVGRMVEVATAGAGALVEDATAAVGAMVEEAAGPAVSFPVDGGSVSSGTAGRLVVAKGHSSRHPPSVPFTPRLKEQVQYLPQNDRVSFVI